MPELPDVEVFKRYIDATSLHKKITKVDISTTRILEDISKQRLQDTLLHNSLTTTYRQGKYLFVQLKNEKWMILHFGMTGFVKYFKDNNEKPSHTRILVSFENNYHFAVNSQRLLGTIGITDDKETYLCDHKVGVDALRISFKEFKDLLENRRGMVKSTLMNQSIIAGIGNIYSDEICFQTGIHPKTKMNQLKTNQLKNMYQNMQDVFNTAIDAQVNPEKFPDTFIIPQRSKEGTCPKGGGPLKTIKVNGRTTYFCPKHQKK